jgi:hypothetical protein
MRGAPFLWLAATVLVLAQPALAQTTFVLDPFDAASNQMLEAHTAPTGGAWTRFTGSSGIRINAATDDIRNVAAGDWNLYGSAATPPANQYVVGISVTFDNNDADNFVQVFGRGNVFSASGYLAQVTANGSVLIAVVVSGNPTIIAAGTAPMAADTEHKVVFSIRNSAKELYVDGVLRASSTNNTVTAVGAVGLGLNSNVAGETVADDFFASTFAPTAVTFFDAGAVHERSGRTLLRWSTAMETANFGFRVHRRTAAGLERLTPEWIAGSALLAGTTPLGAGHTYRWLDSSAPLAAEYWIEEKSLDGVTRWHGPILPAPGSIDAGVSSPTVARLSSSGIVQASAPRVAANAVAGGKRRAVGLGQSTRRQLELAAGPAVKIGVERDGWYRITRAELTAAQLDPQADARTLALYEDGVEVPVLVEDDGSLLFYGRPLDSQWSLARTYWLVAGAQPGKRIARVAPPAGSQPQEHYTAYVERRDKAIYVAALRTEEGDAFVGAAISTDPAAPTIQELTLTDVVPGHAGTLEVSIQGASSEANVPHRVRVAFNGTVLGVVEIEGQARITRTFALPAEAIQAGTNRVGLAALGGEGDINSVVSLRAAYERRYRAVDGSLLMSLEGGRLARLEGFASPAVRVLDITDPLAPFEVPASFQDGAVTVVAAGSGRRVLLAQHTDAFLRAATVAANVPSALHATSGADLIVVVHPSLAAAIEPLRAHRTAQGLKVVVATTDDVYDEWSFGAKDPAAIRAFASHSRSWTRAPRWLLLVGDASFDPRNYMGLGGGAADLVPSRTIPTSLLRTASDSWFTDVDGDGISEIAVGRLPAQTPEQVSAMVAKIIAYDTAPAGADWMKRALIVRDTDPALDFRAQTDPVQAELPEDLRIVTIDAATLGAAGARQELLRELDAGALLAVYAGHGSVENWSAERLLVSQDAATLNNGPRAPFVIAMTCLNGYFHDVFSVSLGEALLRAGGGGAVAVWTSSALTETIAQTGPAVALTRSLFEGGTTLGEATIAAQREATFPDVRRTFLLLGDPSMRIRR